MSVTDEQDKALEAAKDILKEHFDSFVLCVRQSDEFGKYAVSTDWWCPIPEALGLARIGVLRLEEIVRLQTSFDSIGEDEE